MNYGSGYHLIRNYCLHNKPLWAHLVDRKANSFHRNIVFLQKLSLAQKITEITAKILGIQYQLLSSLCPRRKCSIQGNTCSRRIRHFRKERDILLSTELLGDRRKELQTCIWLLSSTGCGYRIQGSSLFSPPLGKETCSAFEINHLPPASKET